MIGYKLAKDINGCAFSFLTGTNIHLRVGHRYLCPPGKFLLSLIKPLEDLKEGTMLLTYEYDTKDITKTNDNGDIEVRKAILKGIEKYETDK